MPEGAVHDKGPVVALFYDASAQVFGRDDAVLLTPQLGAWATLGGRIDDPHVDCRVSRRDDDTDFGVFFTKGHIEAKLDVKVVGV